MWLAACFLARYSGRMTLRRWHASLTLRLFAFALAYALAFAPALADAARGLTKAAHPAGMAMCLTSPDGSGPAQGDPSGLHDECCLAGCRLASPFMDAPAAAIALPSRSASSHAIEDGALSPDPAPAARLRPPATGPPACA